MNTPSSSSSDGLADAVRENARRYVTLAMDYREDPDLRARAESDATGVVAERGFEIPPGVDVRLVANTPETYHVVLPLDPNATLSDGDLAAVAGGTHSGAGLDWHLPFDFPWWDESGPNREHGSRVGSTPYSP